MASPSRKKIKEDLLNQLSSQGKYDAYNIDMVEDYMILYDLKKKLKTWRSAKNSRQSVLWYRNMA